MISSESQAVARRAAALYESRLRDLLEADHRDEFVAIEPESGDHFLGNSLSAAIQAARTVHPQRLSFALRIGHPATIHLGVMST